MWKNKKIEKSKKMFNGWTLVLFKNSAVFAASEKKNVVELNMNLDVVKKFKGRESRPFTIDANENYIVVGYGTGFVDVHGRNELDRYGLYQKISVS